MPMGENTLTVSIITPDDNSSNNTIETTFNDGVYASNELSLTILNNSNGSQCTWNIKNSSGTIVESGGPYANSQTIQESITLSEGCYTFNLMDSGGDGGSNVTLEDDFENQIFYSPGNYNSGASVEFMANQSDLVPSAEFSIGTTNVPVNQPIYVTFNVPIQLPNGDPITDPASLIYFRNLDDGNTDVPFTAEIKSNNKVIEIIPDAELELLTNYRIMIIAGTIESMFEVVLNTNIIHNFQTTETIVGLNLNSEEIKIYPNPAEDVLFVSNAKNSDLIIYDILGKSVYSEHINSEKSSININNLEQGTYIVKIISGKNLFTKKINIVK